MGLIRDNRLEQEVQAFSEARSQQHRSLSSPKDYDVSVEACLNSSNSTQTLRLNLSEKGKVRGVTIHVDLTIRALSILMTALSEKLISDLTRQLETNKSQELALEILSDEIEPYLSTILPEPDITGDDNEHDTEPPDRILSSGLRWSSDIKKRAIEIANRRIEEEDS